MRAGIRLVAVACLSVVATACSGSHDSQRHEFEVTRVTEGLEQPWGMTFLPDGDILVTEQSGRLSRVDPDSGERTGISGVPEVHYERQAGLLDVALHPRFPENRWVYLSYVEPGEGGILTAVGRGRLEGGALQDFEVIFRATPRTPRVKHFGSRLVFDDQGYLFITSGERGQREYVQPLDAYYGKMVRLHDDGTVPADNPFVDREGAEPGIYSYGHRNPQGMIVHPPTGRIWINEHGPQGGDEINIIKPGLNYGWPLTSHGEEYGGGRIGPPTMEGVEPPIYHWTPSIAPSGMAYYDGDAFPRWRGNIFVGALAHTHLARLEMDGAEVVAEEKLLDDEGWRIRAVVQGPDDLLYLLVDDEEAPILRLSPVQ